MIWRGMYAPIQLSGNVLFSSIAARLHSFDTAHGPEYEQPHFVIYAKVQLQLVVGHLQTSTLLYVFATAPRQLTPRKDD